jgi:hypothetical protein
MVGRLIFYVAFLSTLASQGLHGQETTGANASTPAAEVSFAEVRRALRNLEADELQTRDAAETRLIEMGAGVIPFLPEVTPRTSGEIKVRLQRIRQALQATVIEEFFAASLVTLQGDFPLDDALTQISKQTGNQIVLQNQESLSTRTIQADFTQEPFWSALETIMSQVGLRINPFSTTQNELVLAAAGDQAQLAPSAYTTGPFRLDVISVQSTLPFHSSLNGQLALSFQLTWEPRLKPVFMQLPMQSLSAQLDSGESLAATNPRAAPEVPLNLGGCTAQVDLQLTRPPRTASLVEQLNGELIVAVPSERHKYVFEKFGNGARQVEKYGQVTVTLEGTRRNGAVYEIRVLVEFQDAQGALDSFRGWILSNEAYLLDKQETRLENVGLQTYAILPNAVGIAYLFQVNGDPDDYRLVYESPGSITKQRIKYRFNQVPLP